MLTTLAVIAGGILLGTIAGIWFLKRKLAGLGQGLPGALEQWEKEIEKLEKPKG